MTICLVTPAPPHSHSGNRVTASRWEGMLTDLGHGVSVRQHWNGEPCDLLIALHARRSFPSIQSFKRARPDAPVVVVLTGTDLYPDLASSEHTQSALALATRVIVLQPAAVDELPADVRPKVRVIVQSAQPPAIGERDPGVFQVCVLAHLRAVKDPLRAAQAARLLPPSSRIQVVHAGAALDADMAERARDEETANPRYRWLGDLPHSEALRLLGRSHLLALTSKLEGGANALSEAVAASVPPVSSRIPGSIGLLGESYPGYFAAGDTPALATLLLRAETDRTFYEDLRAWCARLQPLLAPDRERERWKDLLEELA